MASEGTRAGTAAHRLRARWLAPSPPLAIDDEPTWTPLPEGEDEEVGAGAGAGAVGERPPAAPAAS